MLAAYEDSGGSGSAENCLDEEFYAGSPTSPVLFGKYLLLGKLARGGMAEIYRGLSAAGIPPSLLAIKCMRQNLAEEGRFVEMFIREGKLAMMMEHDGIVRTLDVGSVDGRYFIAMEHISGKDLTQVLRRCQETGRRIPLPHALHIAQQVSSALHYAHDLRSSQDRPLNIVNRDVSPSNIRLSYSGEVKLLDFGIAQAMLQVTSEIGILKGKFSYMSPEQVRGLPLDRRTDIFSTGIVLHEMLSCSRLFRDDSEFVLMEKVRRAQVSPPSAFNPRVPPELDSVAMRALQRELDERYQDAGEMADDLRQLLAEYQFTAAELGEFLKGLFSSDYHRDLAEEQTCLANVTSEPETARRVSSQRVTRRRQRRAPTQEAVSTGKNKAVWLAAVIILGAGLALLGAALLF